MGTNDDPLDLRWRRHRRTALRNRSRAVVLIPTTCMENENES